MVAGRKDRLLLDRTVEVRAVRTAVEFSFLVDPYLEDGILKVLKQDAFKENVSKK